MSCFGATAMCRPIRWAGVLIIVAFAVYAHSLSRLDAGCNLLPPFQPDIPRYSNLGQLGAENWTLALHLTNGKGFSDPFALGTGPTAWMSPVYPSLLAVLVPF